VNPGAEIRVLPDPSGGPAGPFGPCTSVQAAELDVPEEFLERSWNVEYLERLARAYWAYIERFSLGLLKVRYEPNARTVVLAGRIPLLRFRRPEYVTTIGLGQVTWPIERGLLVSPAGRGRGYLRVTVRRLEPRPELPPEMESVLVTATVANFYPGLRFSGVFTRIGAWIYNQTQLRIHVLVTHGFLRSLTTLELPESRVGALRQKLGVGG
jgi:GNAT superfamily N-acetyltransferase